MCIRVQATHVATNLSFRKMLGQHKQACKQGKRHECDVCNKSYASSSILKQHKRVSHGPDAPEPDEAFFCPHCNKEYRVKKSIHEHAGERSQVHFPAEEF